MSTSNPQNNGLDRPSHSRVLDSSRPSVSTATAPPSSESSGTDLDEMPCSVSAGNCFCDTRRPSSTPKIPHAPVNPSVLDAVHSSTPTQPHDAAVSTAPLREATKTECNTKAINTTLASTLHVPEKCKEFYMTSSGATEVPDNTCGTCKLSDNVSPVNPQPPDTTTTQCNRKQGTSHVKLSGRPTSL